MANVFTRTPVKRVKRNVFNLSHDVKLSFDMGELIPTLVQECIPGDSFSIRNETLVRFSPMIAPVMHNINVHTHYFFVPNRIVFPDWEDFISADLSKETPVSWPYISKAPGAVGSLWDYMGLPVGTTSTITNVSAIPFCAYQAIYNDYYRDENLIEPVPFECTPGDQEVSLENQFLTLRRRSWMHDYFTSALPFAQKGPSVDIPIGEFNDVEVYDGSSAGFQMKRFSDGSSAAAGDLSVTAGDYVVSSGAVGQNLSPDGLMAKTSELTAGAASINDLRVAFRLQEWFEKAARGGSRYIEQIAVHFDVRSSDARLNRPEFLGGSRNKVIISEVLQTSSTDETSPQGDMAGHGIAGAGSGTIRYFCEEHGYIIGITSITPLTAYQDGIPRHFTRLSWEDYAWPTFSHLGEQAILNREIYLSGNSGTDQETFGYTPRYSEYRYTPSRVAGDFRDSLSYWHLGRIFNDTPVLNKAFVECTPRKDIFAVTSPDIDSMWCHAFNKVIVKRKLPRFGAPAL